MPPIKPAKDDPEAQLRRFQDAAREPECNDDAERFNERVETAG